MQRKITSLKAQKRNPQRVNVYLDGEFAFGLSRFVAAWLQVGQEIDHDRIIQLLAQDELETAHQKAIKFISYKPRTEYELRKKLSELDYSDNVISTIVDRLKNVGLVDDNNYASLWVNDQIMHHPKSSRLMAYELRKRGIDQEIVISALENIDDTQLALLVSKKRLRTLMVEDSMNFRKKLFSYLYRQGFNSEVCNRVISQILDHKEDNEFFRNKEALL